MRLLETLTLITITILKTLLLKIFSRNKNQNNNLYIYDTFAYISDHVKGKYRSTNNTK